MHFYSIFQNYWYIGIFLYLKHESVCEQKKKKVFVASLMDPAGERPRVSPIYVECPEGARVITDNILYPILPATQVIWQVEGSHTPAFTSTRSFPHRDANDGDACTAASRHLCEL